MTSSSICACHDALNPSTVHGSPRELVRTLAPNRGKPSSKAFRSLCIAIVEAKTALAERRHWLVAQGLAVRQTDNSVMPKPRLLPALFNPELARLEQVAARQAGVPSYRIGNDEPIKGRYENAIVQPSIKLAVIRSDDEVAIVPWSSALERHRGREIAGHVRDRSIELVLGRSRGLER